MMRADAGTWLWRAGGCFLLAAPVTFVRAMLAGSLAVEKGAALAWIGTFLVLGLPLVAACLCLLRALGAAPETPWRRLAVGAMALHLLAWPSLPITSNDVFSNLAYGHMARRGLDPGQVGPSALGADDPFGRLVSPRWRDTPSVYGPLSLAVARWAVAGGSVVEGLVRFKLAMLAAALAIAAAAFGLARRFPGAEGKRRALLVAASPLVVWEFTAQAHNDALMVLGLTLAVWAVLSERPWIALGCALAAAAAKGAALPIAALLAVSMLRAPRTRWPLLALAGAAAALLVVFLPGALPALLRAPLAATGAFDPDRHARSIPEMVIGFDPVVALGVEVQHRLYWPFWSVHIVAFAAVFAWAAWKARTPRDALHGATWTLLVYLWTAPWTQPWYGTWLVPLLAVEEDVALRRAGVVYTFLLAAQYALAIEPVTYLLINGLPLWMLWRARAGRPTALASAVPA